MQKQFQWSSSMSYWNISCYPVTPIRYFLLIQKLFWTIPLILSFLASFYLSELFWSTVFMAFFNVLLTTLGTIVFCIAKGLPLQSCSLSLTCSFLLIHMSSQDTIPQGVYGSIFPMTLLIVIHLLDLQTVILLLWKVLKGKDYHWC